MTVITALRDELSEAGLRLRKAQPRGPGRLTMELDGVHGRVCAGQWHADPAETARVAALLLDRFGADAVQVLDGGRLVVQRGGADRKLPVLRRVVEDPGALLVAHRPERRAVVRVGTDRYLKVVRPGRTSAVVDPLRTVRPEDVRVPEVLGVDDRRGLVCLSAVPGPTLIERLTDPWADDDELAVEAKGVGVAVRSLHAHPTPAAYAVHGAADQVAAARRWLEAADAHGLLPQPVWSDRLHRLGELFDPPPSGLVLLHRDLHDKQVVLGEGRTVGLLDLDLVACGDPAVDLANLLVHLELRARQGRCTRDRADLCSAALLEGYSPAADLRARLRGHAAATRLRLAGLYCFRDGPVGLVGDLVREMEEVPDSWL